ncbi:MAG: helix-hairpin-helix domain-containing protein [Patescibacteria group bacterium]|jgi:competence protein ComEA
MSNFFQSFLPLLKKLRLKKYFLEILLLSSAALITVVSLSIYLNSTKSNPKVTETSQTYLTSENTIFVDVSGAVKKPDLYEFVVGTRIKEVINKAGGLSDEVDLAFFKRNFNLSRVVNDQEKIYVPSSMEINAGIFIQNIRTFDYVSPALNVSNNTSIDQPPANQMISLNSATIEELDQLPGIGQVTANKIIINRPYLTIEELLTKKTINKNVFEKIKNLISI